MDAGGWAMGAKKQHARGTKTTKKPEPAQRSAGEPATSQAPPTRPAVDTAVETKPEQSGPPVAGIGASAGGLDAFKKFFTAMPADSGIAFVLMPHLDPKHESLMVELLARCSKMPVVEAADGMAAQANCVYIIPPNMD